MRSDKDKLTGVAGSNELGEARLWKTLDSISNDLVGIKSSLFKLIQLEEKVSNIGSVLSRYGNKFDDHDLRIRETELWQAGNRNNFRINNLVKSELEAFKLEVDNNSRAFKIEVDNNFKTLKLEVGNTSKTQTRNTGQKDVVKEIIKIAVSMVVAITIYKMTKG